MGLLLDPCAPADPGIVGLDSQRPGRPLVGLNVSGLLSRTGGKYGLQAGFASDYDSMVVGLIDFLIQSKGASVLLIPHVFGRAKDGDTLICEHLYRELQPRYPGRLGLAAGNYDQGQIKFIIGSCDFFLGSRMHACIAAISQAVPAVSLAYSDKFIGVMETLGLAPLVVDLRTMTGAEIHRAVDSALAGTAEWRARLEIEIPKMKAAILGLFVAANSSIATAGSCAPVGRTGTL
jgi:polysaccharide pyruvyl transferase WcaK-like protein